MGVAEESGTKAASLTAMLMGMDHLGGMDLRLVGIRGTAVGMTTEIRNDRVIEYWLESHYTSAVCFLFDSSADLTAPACMHGSCLNGLGRHSFLCVFRSRGM